MKTQSPVSLTAQQVAGLWRKLPSVSREGKFFYRRGFEGAGVTVMQSWMTNTWSITQNGRCYGAFRTAQIAMDYADSLSPTPADICTQCGAGFGNAGPKLSLRGLVCVVCANAAL